jgi:hypothetical protein
LWSASAGAHAGRQGAYKKGSGDLRFRAKNGLLWEVCA